MDLTEDDEWNEKWFCVSKKYIKRFITIISGLQYIEVCVQFRVRGDRLKLKKFFSKEPMRSKHDTLVPKVLVCLYSNIPLESLILPIIKTLHRTIFSVYGLNDIIWDPYLATVHKKKKKNVEEFH